MILDGKRLVLTGVASPDSIATAVSRRAVELGAEVLLAVYPRDERAAREVAADLPGSPPVEVADVTNRDDIERLAAAATARFGEVDGVLHAVAFAPRDALEAPMTGARLEAVDLAFRTSTASFALVADLAARLSPPTGGSVVGLDFDSSRAWDMYRWMGVCKAGLESLARYLARELGPRGTRVNLVAAGPLRTRAASAIPGFDALVDGWPARAPLGWDPTDAAPVADAVCFLFSDLARATTGEILHVDGGHHATAC